MFQDPEIQNAAEALYDDVLPYHNFGHVRYVLSSAESLLEQCLREHIQVDEEVVYYAILFHDAGYADDHVAKGFETKEAYSADLAEQVLTKHKLDHETVERVKHAILCTHFAIACENDNDKAVKSSDLSGLAEDYSVFKSNAVNLMHEAEILSGKTNNWNEWKQSAAEKLELYLNEDFSLTRDNPGNSIFTDKARANIQRMLKDETTD